MSHSRWSLAVTLVLASLAGEAYGQGRPDTGRRQMSEGRVFYSVVYTGRLFGYFRYQSVQDDKTSTCSAVSEKPTGPTKVLLDKIGKAPMDGADMRVAVGDNFAPFLLGRNMRFNDDFLSKDLLLYDDEAGKWFKAVDAPARLVQRVIKGEARLTYDNVGCFLRFARFDAVVPGKHDFYFGPERLRALAGLLASQADGDFRPVQMLAANLSFVTKDPERTAVTDEHVEHKGYDLEAKPSLQGATPILPKVPLPWVRRFRIGKAFRINTVHDSGGLAAGYDPEDLLATAKFPSSELNKLSISTKAVETIVDRQGRRYEVAANVGAVLICPAERQKPNRVSLPVKGDLQRCKQLQRGASEDHEKLSLTWPYHLAASTASGPGDDVTGEFALTPDTNWAICLYESKDLSGTPYCVPFSVHTPLLEPTVQRPALGERCELPRGGTVMPFVLKETPAGTCVAIFGVVDPSLKEYVGALNYTWLNKTVMDDELRLNARLTTEIQVSDPVEALTQLLQYCGANAPCRSARKILLAQMPRSKAGQVAARFAAGTFDLVVSQTDEDRASGDFKAERPIELNSEGVNGVAEPAVVVPGPHFPGTNANAIQVRLQRADVQITPQAPMTELRQITHITRRAHEILPIDPLPPMMPGPGAKPLFDWIAGAPVASALPTRPATRSAKIDVLEKLALIVLRKHCNADVALLQHRDLFISSGLAAQSVDKSGLRIALDAVYWKGDFIACRSVTGDTLKKLLDRSKELTAAEGNSLFSELEFGRGLAYLGVMKSHDDYIIDGALLEAKKLYAVATTDFLAEGDTGYTALQTAQPGPDPIAKLGEIDRLSGKIYAALLGEVDLVQDDTKLPAGQYLDVSSQRPFDSTRQTGWHVVADWTKGFFGAGKADAPGAERQFQQRPLWSISLENLNLKYTSYQHDLTEKQVNDFFGGTGIDTLVSPNAHSFGTDVQLRMKRSVNWVDLYGLVELHRQYDQKNKNDESRVASQTKNDANLEGGTLMNAFGWRRDPSSYKVMTALRLETQLDDPFQNVELSNGVTRPVSLARTRTLSAKIGLRHEFKDSWFEAGWLGGNKHQGATMIAVSGKSAGAVTEVPCPAASLAKCVKESSLDELIAGMPVAGTSLDHREFGAFFNVRAHAPLGIGTLKWLTEETGKWLLRRPDDTAVDTRYRIDWKNTLEVPVVGNFSLAPSLSMLFFEDKAAEPHTYFSTSVSIELKYAFEWHSGLSFRKAAVFANPAAGK